MKPAKIRVYAYGDNLVPDYDAFEHNIKRFVGRRAKPQAGTVAPGELLTSTLGADYLATRQPVELNYRHEYRQHLQDEDLMPADMETAELCGVFYIPPEYLFQD